jgi:hypothetical protein
MKPAWLKAGRPGIESRQGKPQGVQTGSGAHPASYPMGSWGSPPSSAEVKKDGAIPPLTQYVFMASASLVKYKGSLTISFSCFDSF